MDEPREQLRKILCPDTAVDSALKILEKLVALHETGRKNWYQKSEIIDARNTREVELFERLHNGGLINGLYMCDSESYSLNKIGMDLYRQLQTVQQKY